ncbi:MAG TPA: hypothetical protein VGG82_07560 [Casimicrobiaceae bacterium]
MAWEHKGGPFALTDARGHRIPNGEGRKAGSKVPPAKRKAKRRRKK